MSPKMIAVIILVSMMMIFIVQNVAAVDVVFLFWSLSLSRALLIFFCLLIGALIGWTLHSFIARRRPFSDPEE